MSSILRGACALLAVFAAAGQARASGVTTLFTMNGGSTGYASAGRPLRAANGMIYGTAYAGGANGGGLLFAFDPASGNYATLQEWTTFGADGTTPAGSLLLSAKGVLYGITEAGGTGNCSQGCGTLWQYDTISQTYTTLYHFGGGADGASPQAGLTFGPGQKILYGTTVYGGNFQACRIGCGTIFAFSLTSHTLVTLHAFNVDDGASPQSHPLLLNGQLYGTTPSGGANGSGNLWRLNPATLSFTSLHDFDYHVDGSAPDGELLLRAGVLYGETAAGGSTGSTLYGSLFSYTVSTGAFASLYTFQNGGDGASPQGGLVAGAGGMLYGTAGSQNGAGEIFGFKPAKKTVSQLYQFTNGGDGALPQTGLAAIGPGQFIGVTSHPPTTLFRFTP